MRNITRASGFGFRAAARTKLCVMDVTVSNGVKPIFVAFIACVKMEV